MGLVTYEQELSSSIPPAKLFKAFVHDGDHLIPKAFPQAFKSIQNIHGDGGVGTIKLITFGEGSQFKSVKHRVDEIDEANHVYKYSIIEGDVLGDDLESISYVVKFEASADGGSVSKTVSHYHTKHDAHGITEEKIKEGKEKAKAIFKAVEAHLHAHPHDC
ncbi:pathogenesis-related protein 10.4 [Dorcoceras hygrometricum]|uniref:Pathogenesis-related protein 10.4 n=1 Tax=Dorcoceras hygrometricum TaxID=472368 RepID=A0A2Z7CV86_9LAMI|nr:pathogenesis-related protein 10.4 [Dorcoceras hygrometricum]